MSDHDVDVDELTHYLCGLVSWPRMSRAIWTGDVHGVLAAALEEEVGKVGAANVCRRVDAHVVACVFRRMAVEFEKTAADPKRQLDIRMLITAVRDLEDVALPGGADYVIQGVLLHCATERIMSARDLRAAYTEAQKILLQCESLEESPETSEFREKGNLFVRRLVRTGLKNRKKMTIDGSKCLEMYPFDKLIQDMKETTELINELVENKERKPQKRRYRGGEREQPAAKRGRAASNGPRSGRKRRQTRDERIEADDDKIDEVEPKDEQLEEEVQPNARKATRKSARLIAQKQPTLLKQRTPQRRRLTMDEDEEVRAEEEVESSDESFEPKTPVTASRRRTPTRQRPATSEEEDEVAAANGNDEAKIEEEEEEQESEEYEEEEIASPVPKSSTRKLRSSQRKVKETLEAATEELKNNVVDPLADAVKHAKTARRGSQEKSKSKNMYRVSPRGREATPISDSDEDEDEARTPAPKRVVPFNRELDRTPLTTPQRATKAKHVTGELKAGKFSVEEDKLLTAGLREFGWSQWSFISSKWSHLSYYRNQHQIKDRARYLEKSGRISRDDYPPEFQIKRPGPRGVVPARVARTKSPTGIEAPSTSASRPRRSPRANGSSSRYAEKDEDGDEDEDEDEDINDDVDDVEEEENEES